MEKKVIPPPKSQQNIRAYMEITPKTKDPTDTHELDNFPSSAPQPIVAHTSIEEEKKSESETKNNLTSTSDLPANKRVKKNNHKRNKDGEPKNPSNNPS
jgi:hypothetical protein